LGNGHLKPKTRARAPCLARGLWRRHGWREVARRFGLPLFNAFSDRPTLVLPALLLEHRLSLSGTAPTLPEPPPLPRLPVIACISIETNHAAHSTSPLHPPLDTKQPEPTDRTSPRRDAHEAVHALASQSDGQQRPAHNSRGSAAYSQDSRSRPADIERASGARCMQNMLCTVQLAHQTTLVTMHVQL
jgi:hypothetical protein